MNIWDIDKALLFIVLVLPGFISLKVYDLIVAGENRDFSKSIVESVAYSVLNFAALSWLIIKINTPNFQMENPFNYWAYLVLIFIIFPSVWPFIFIWLSKLKIFKKHLLNPINQPWDKVFSRRQAYWVTVHLKDDTIIRGKYSLKSSASAYPKERQIYLEEVWKAGEKGGFGKKMERSMGVILFESEIRYIEFYK